MIMLLFLGGVLGLDSCENERMGDLRMQILGKDEKGSCVLETPLCGCCDLVQQNLEHQGFLATCGPELDQRALQLPIALMKRFVTCPMIYVSWCHLESPPALTISEKQEIPMGDRGACRTESNQACRVNLALDCREMRGVWAGANTDCGPCGIP